MLAAQVTDNSYKGWQASLALQFCHTPEKTLLHSAHHVGPLTVQRPFYPEGETCHLYLLHPPGGVVGGDRLDITVRLDAKSHALITMPGASKFYRSSGPQARLHQHFYLDEGSTLEWLLFYPANEEHLDTVRALLAPLGHFAGATLTDELLSVRFLSHDNLICQRVMRDIWQSLRPLLTTKTACSPRIWQT